MGVASLWTIEYLFSKASKDLLLNRKMIRLNLTKMFSLRNFTTTLASLILEVMTSTYL